MGFAQNITERNTNRQLDKIDEPVLTGNSTLPERLIFTYSSLLQSSAMIVLPPQSFFSSLYDFPFFCSVAACFSPFPRATHNYPQQGVKTEQHENRAKFLREICGVIKNL